MTDDFTIPTGSRRGLIGKVAGASPGNLAAAALLFGCGMAAADISTHSTLRLRVGETRRIGVFGGHSRDCMSSSPPEIRIVRAPALGTVSQREGVPYVARTSVSGTCIGSRFVGTEIDYTAVSPGAEVVELDAVFANGTDHRTVTITAR